MKIEYQYLFKPRSQWVSTDDTLNSREDSFDTTAERSFEYEQFTDSSEIDNDEDEDDNDDEELFIFQNEEEISGQEQNLDWVLFDRIVRYVQEGNMFLGENRASGDHMNFHVDDDNGEEDNDMFE